MLHFTLRKRAKHPDAKTLYQYHRGLDYNPGAPEFVFEPLNTNPVVLARGRGRIAGMLAIFQSPQVRVTPVTRMAGLGGLQQGQMAFQPLIDPNSPMG